MAENPGPDTVNLEPNTATPEPDTVDHEPDAVSPGPDPLTLAVDVLPDTDSAIGDDDIESSTASLRSSIYAHVYENGRRYHSFRAGKYVLPNDETEQERLDLSHHTFRLSLKGGLCLTKLDNPKRILDVGTGTGIWAIDIGDLYPEAEVIGTDLSPIQPQWVPNNVKFEIDDCTDDW